MVSFLTNTGITMNLQGIHLIWITVSDIQQAVKFYTDTIGFKLDVFSEDYGWAELTGKDGARLGLAQAKDDSEYTSGNNAVITITVDDLEKARKELLQKQINLVDDVVEVPGHVKLQTFKDQDGNMFQLCQLL